MSEEQSGEVSSAPVSSCAIPLAAAAGILLLAVAGGGIWAWAVALMAGIGWAAILWTRPIHVFPAALRLACLAAMALILLSLLPLPLPLSRLAGGERYRQNALAAHAIREASATGMIPSSVTMFSATRNRAGTLRIGLLLAAAFASGLLAAALPSDRRRHMAGFLTCVGLGIAGLGLVSMQYIPQGDRLWWWIPIPHNLPGPIACFANRNHFAGFAAMTAVAALALALDAIRRRRPMTALLWATAFCGAAFAVVLSLSRGAWIACAAGCAITSLLVPFASRWAKAAGIVFILLLLAGAIAAGLRSPEVTERLDTLKDPMATESAKIRIPAWKDGLRIGRHYWFAGCGANGFRMVYPQFKTTSQSAFMTYPENAYVQLVAETGLCGLAILAILVWHTARTVRRQLAEEDSYLFGMIAAGVGCVALVHGCVDVPTLVPVYSAILAAYVGLAVRCPAQSDEAGKDERCASGCSPGTLCRAESSEAEKTHNPADTPPRRLQPHVAAWDQAVERISGGKRFPAFLLACTVGMGLLAIPAQRLDHYAHFSAADTAFLARSLTWAPTSWQSWYNLGHRAMQSGTASGYRMGERWISQAAAYDPKNYRLWKELGDLRLYLGDRAGARQAYDRVKALRPWVQVPELEDGRHGLSDFSVLPCLRGSSSSGVQHNLQDAA